MISFDEINSRFKKAVAALKRAAKTLSIMMVRILERATFNLHQFAKSYLAKHDPPPKWWEINYREKTDTGLSEMKTELYTGETMLEAVNNLRSVIKPQLILIEEVELIEKKGKLSVG